jgi:hypothetical protein
MSKILTMQCSFMTLKKKNSNEQQGQHMCDSSRKLAKFCLFVLAGLGFKLRALSLLGTVPHPQYFLL